MPFYLALFWFISRRAGVLDRRAILYSIAGFAAALLPMALWLGAHPDAARSLAMQDNRADPGSTTLMQSLSSGGASAALSDMVRIYWSYFDPSFLFVQGGNARTLSTGEVGVFLFPIAVLAPIGFTICASTPLIRLLYRHWPRRRADSRGDQGRAVCDPARVRSPDLREPPGQAWAWPLWHYRSDDRARGRRRVVGDDGLAIRRLLSRLPHELPDRIGSRLRSDGVSRHGGAHHRK